MTKRNGLTLWQYIAETIGEEIRGQAYEPGCKLPTEAELAERFGVNRHTVRRAIAVLEEKGLVRTEQGRGTFVQEDIIDFPLSERIRFSAVIRSQSKNPAVQCVRSMEIAADEMIAEALEIPVHAPIGLIETVDLADDQPISIAAHHFPLHRFPQLFEVYEEERKFTPTLKRLGVERYLRKSARISCRMPDGYEKQHLRLARLTPILCVETVNVDGERNPIEFCQTRFASGRTHLLVDTLSR